MMKKLMAGLAAGVAALMIAGCGGNDLSGKYMAEPVTEADTITYILDVKKGEKEGYNMNFCTAEYNLTKDLGEGSVYHNPLFSHTKEKDVYIYDYKGKFEYEIADQLFSSAPDKNNTMVFKKAKNPVFMGGIPTGTFEVDKEGNLIDVAGVLTPVQGRKFVKVKEVNMDEVKKNLKDNITKNLHKENDKETASWTSKVGTITFDDDQN